MNKLGRFPLIGFKLSEEQTLTGSFIYDTIQCQDSSKQSKTVLGLNNNKKDYRGLQELFQTKCYVYHSLP